MIVLCYENLCVKLQDVQLRYQANVFVYLHSTHQKCICKLIVYYILTWIKNKNEGVPSDWWRECYMFS